MISLVEAQKRLFMLAPPLPAIRKPLSEAIDHYLAADLIAQRSQPSADMSAMDGYAICFSGGTGPWKMIGESAAGTAFNRQIGKGEAVRIFTGAHLPGGADSVVIQEDVQAVDQRIAMIGDANIRQGQNVRKAGSDFTLGDVILPRGAKLTAGAIGAAAMAGYADLSVGGLPKISIISSGDELVPPGMPLQEAQIPSSNGVMIAAMVNDLPCEQTDRGIAADTMESLAAKLSESTGDNIIVTIGGASVGDHDLVQRALMAAGAQIDFWRIAMRPGKPVMAGKLGNSIVLGLPGNPGSAFVTAFLLLLPLIRHLAGCNAPYPAIRRGRCTAPLPAGGTRAEYVRAIATGSDLKPFVIQDSGMTKPLASANALIIWEAGAPEIQAGEWVDYLPIDV